MQTIASILNKINKEKFDLIAQNENYALRELKSKIIDAIYEVVINKISYDLKEIKTSNTSLTDENGNMRKCINEGSLGIEKYIIANEIVREKSIYDENFMEIDSEIEKRTIDESSDKKITVFGKLPRVNIPTAHGRNYNPDFGYVIEQKGKKELYFIVETKGYDSFEKISKKEQLQIKSAEKFFEKLKDKGINIEYKTKLNSPELSQIIGDILTSNKSNLG